MNTNQEGIATTVKRRKWKWISYTLRKDTNNVTRQALDYNPGKEETGYRPRNAWRRSMLEDLEKIKLAGHKSPGV